VPETNGGGESFFDEHGVNPIMQVSAPIMQVSALDSTSISGFLIAG
jgi:hypothetical protein